MPISDADPSKCREIKLNTDYIFKKTDMLSLLWQEPFCKTLFLRGVVESDDGNIMEVVCDSPELPDLGLKKFIVKKDKDYVVDISSMSLERGVANYNNCPCYRVAEKPVYVVVYSAFEHIIGKEIAEREK